MNLLNSRNTVAEIRFDKNADNASAVAYLKSVSEKKPRHKLVFLSFDCAKDQTLYGKECLRALPKMFLFCLLSFPRYW